MSNQDELQYLAVLGDTIPGKEGQNGGKSPDFVVTFPALLPEDESATFTLVSNVWKGDEPPEKTRWVILTQMRRKSGKWRAMRARPFEPSDEITDTSLVKQRKIIEKRHLAQQQSVHEELEVVGS